MIIKNTFKKLALTAAVATFCSAVSADTIRIASGVPPKHPGHDPLYTEFQKLLPEMSEGRLNAMILGPEVVKLPGMRDAIKAGLVDAGLFLPAYFPADLPEINLVADMAFMGNSAQAMSAAMTEYVVNCGACQAELKKLGVVYSTTNSTNTYRLLSKTPIKSIDDMKGKRMRVGGPQFSRWVDSVGGTPVSTPVGETFEALSQGIIEGTLASPADYVSFRLGEVTRYMTDINLGTYHSTISHTIRRDKWKSLSPADRKAMLLTSSHTSALATQRWSDISNMGLKMAADSGVKIVQPDQELVDSVSSFLKKDLKQAVKTAEGRGIKDSAQKLAYFQELVTKWEKIADANGNDPAKMGKSMETEIWSKVDFTKYGL